MSFRCNKKINDNIDENVVLIYLNFIMNIEKKKKKNSGCDQNICVLGNWHVLRSGPNVENWGSLHRDISTFFVHNWLVQPQGHVHKIITFFLWNWWGKSRSMHSIACMGDFVYFLMINVNFDFLNVKEAISLLYN